MELKKVVIKNFRSIKNETIEFDNNCQILVGINESGKTNILKAIRLLDPEVKISSDDVRQLSHSESVRSVAEVMFVFRPSDYEWNSIISELKKEIVTDFDSSNDIISIGKIKYSLAEFLNTKREVLYIADLKEAKKRYSIWGIPKEAKIIADWFSPSADTPHGSIKFMVGDDEFDAADCKVIDGKYLSEDQKKLLVKTDANTFNTALSFRLKEKLKANHPTCIFWNYNENNLLPERISISEFSADINTCKPLKYMFWLAGIYDIKNQIESAQARRAGLRNLLMRVAARSSDYLHTAWPDYKHISFDLTENGDYIECLLKDEYNLYGLSARSDGFKRFITFLLSISVRETVEELENVIFIQDEPDTSLHPSAIKYLLSEMLKVSEKNIVILSTHSIFMIDKNNIGRHLIVRKTSEKTEIHRANSSNISDEEVLFNALGYSIFETLRQKNIIFEGWKDKNGFGIATNSPPRGFAKIKKLDRFGRCHATGVKDIERVANFLELANREYIVISDGDTVAKKKQRDYAGSGKWLRYDEILGVDEEITFEDFLDVSYFYESSKAVLSDSYPSRDIEDLVFSEQKPVLKTLSSWLGKNDIRGDEQKEIMKRVKDKASEDLKIENFKNRYFEMLSNLADMLNTHIH